MPQNNYKNSFLLGLCLMIMSPVAFASNDKVSFRFDDGYATATLHISGDGDSMAAKLYQRMEFVRAIDEGLGFSKSWKEQLFQWKCIEKLTGEYACNAKFYDSHPGTQFDMQYRNLIFEGGKDFAQAFVRDQGGFGMGVSGHDLKVIVHKERFTLTVSE